MLLHDIRHCLASIASLACLHVLFFVSLVSPVPGHASDDNVSHITCRDSSSHNFVENMVNIIPYQIAWFVS